ncbi:F-box and WD repeat domain containing protein 10B isoform X3 [Struthio camelus]|uniref:F-box and WD repeat domain containing protein 10B isoform X3 n=1 Tax=Struthio camelus TaxID=8801 RepID=UPI003603CDBC
MERQEYSLYSAPSLRCGKETDLVPVCKTCETCVLAWRIFSTKEWFPRAGALTQRKFLLGIIKRFDSFSLLSYTEKLLRVTEEKDFTYVGSQITYSLRDWNISSSNGTLDPQRLEQDMQDTWRWFAKSGYWTKANYTLLLLKLCDAKLLLTAAALVREQSVLARTDKEDVDESSPKFLNSIKDNSHPQSSGRIHFALQSVSASSAALASRGSSAKTSQFGNTGGQLSTVSFCPQNSEYVFQKGPNMMSKSSVVSLVAPGVTVVPASLQSASHVNKYKDFIRCLPTHLSAYILGLLDRKSLNTCAAVSKCWAFLAKKVKREHVSQKIRQEEIVCLQGSCPRGVVSNYAKIVNVTIPRLNKKGDVIQVKDHKWSSKMKEEEEDSLQLAYHGLQTDTIQLEERNVFCGSYNIRVLTDQSDPNRVIHYSGGNLVAVGSADRKVRFLGVMEMKEVLPLLSGHAGSIKALYLNEKKGFVLSASFDLSIRCWDIYSGACTKIFHGHSGTITCLDLYKDKFVSGAKDGMVKVWDLESRKCLKTLKHNNTIWVVKMDGTHVVSGCDKGLVKVWYADTGTLIKILEGHQGPVKCLSFDQWHLVTGSTDGYALGWSMLGNHKRCVTAFRHPKMVINALSCLLMFQFEDVNWNYTLKTDRETAGKKKEQRKGLSSKPPVHFQRMKHNKVSQKTYQLPLETKDADQLMLSYLICCRSLKGSGMSQTLRYKLMKAAACQPQQNLLKSTKSFSIQAQQKKKLSIPDNQLHTIDSEKSKRAYFAKTAADTDGESEYGSSFYVPAHADRTEATLQYKKKRGPGCPMSPNQILLTTNTLQNRYNSAPVSSSIKRTPTVTEAREPPLHQQERPEKMQIYETPMQHKKVQTVQLQHMRSNSDSLTMKRISTAFETKRLQLKLINSLHGPTVKSSIPAPSIVRPKSYCGLLEEKKARGGHGKVIPLPEVGVQLIGRFTTSSGPIKSTPMIVRVTTEAVSRRKKPFLQYAADPYRIKSGFRLFTGKQKVAYEEATTVQYQAKQTKLMEDQQKESKKAWLRKIKGLPIDSFTKEGKIAAPELGLNTFI